MPVRFHAGHVLKSAGCPSGKRTAVPYRTRKQPPGSVLARVQRAPSYSLRYGGNPVEVIFGQLHKNKSKEA